MTGLLFLLLAAEPQPAPQTPTVALLVARRTGVSLEEVRAVANSLGQKLKELGLTDTPSFDEVQQRLKSADISDTLACGARPPCLMASGKKIRATHVVLLSVTGIAEDRAWVAETYSVTGVALTRGDWTSGGEDAKEPWLPFARALADQLEPAAPQTPPLVTAPDVPRATPTLTPPTLTLPPTPPATTTAALAPPPPRVLPRALLVGAAVAGLAAVVLGSVATGFFVDARATLPQSEPVTSKHTYREADALNTTAITLGVAAGATGVVAAGLGVGAALTW